MLLNISLEAVNDSRVVVEERPDVGRGDIRPRTGEVMACPLYKLIFSAMIVVVLSNHHNKRFLVLSQGRNGRTLSTSGMRSYSAARQLEER